MSKDHHLHHAEMPEAPFVSASFWAPWCTPCRQLPYILDHVEQRLKGQVAILPVNVQESPHLTEEFEVTSLPTLLILRQGHILA